MTRQECMSILSDKTHPEYAELHHIYYYNRNKAKKYFKNLGYGSGYVLHHTIVGCTNYEEWKIDELVPMTREEHSYLHMVIYEQGLGSAESKKKAHDTLKEKYKAGQLVPWNKGLTKQTDTRVKESPRKGKTGEDFTFLKASKKGKSGGWNRGITKDDPRYNSLIHSEQRKQKQSEFMKNNNPMNNALSRQKVGDSKRGKKRYSNGIEIHCYVPGTQPEGYLPVSYFSKRVKNMDKCTT